MQRHQKFSLLPENSSPGYPGKKEMNLNVFYWHAYGDVFPPTPRTPPRLPRLLSSRILGPRCRGSLRRGETKGARVCLTFHTWKDQHPKRKGASDPTINFQGRAVSFRECNQMIPNVSCKSLFEVSLGKRSWKRGHLHPLSSTQLCWVVTNSREVTKS